MDSDTYTLDINNLINKVSDFVHDGNIVGAAIGIMPIQDIAIGNHLYKMSITLELVTYESTRRGKVDNGQS